MRARRRAPRASRPPGRRIRSISSRLSPSTSRRWRCDQVPDPHGHGHAACSGRSITTSSASSVSRRRTWTISSIAGRQVLADEVGADRQFAMAAIDERREPHRARPAVVGQCVEGGAHRPPGVEHVVDEDDDPPADIDLEVRALDDRGVREPGEVVAVVGDVERPDRDRYAPRAARSAPPGDARAGPRGCGCRRARGRRCRRCARRSRARCGSWLGAGRPRPGRGVRSSVSPWRPRRTALKGSARSIPDALRRLGVRLDRGTVEGGRSVPSPSAEPIGSTSSATSPVLRVTSSRSALGGPGSPGRGCAAVTTRCRPVGDDLHVDDEAVGRQVARIDGVGHASGRADRWRGRSTPAPGRDRSPPRDCGRPVHAASHTAYASPSPPQVIAADVNASRSIADVAEERRARSGTRSRRAPSVGSRPATARRPR